MPNECRTIIELDGKNIPESDFENVIIAINQQRLCDQVISSGNSTDPWDAPSCDWAWENWGSKWGLFHSKVYETDGTIIKAFGRYAWNPPWEVYRKLAENGWGLNVKFVDEYCDFVGQITHTTSSNMALYEEWQTSRPWLLKEQLKIKGIGSELINVNDLWEYGDIGYWMSRYGYPQAEEDRNKSLEEDIRVYRIQRSVLGNKTKLQTLDRTGD